MIAAGTYRAKACDAIVWGKSPDKQTPCAQVRLLLVDGPDKGSTIEWVGWLTDNTATRTAESLGLMGYDGADDESVKRNEVIAVIEHEDFVRQNGEKNSRARVAWINDPSGAGRFLQMTAAEVAGAKDRLRAALAASKKPIAANAAAQDEPKF